MNNSEIDRILQSAWTAWENKHHEAAIAILRDALTRYADWAEGYSQLGNYLDRNRQEAQAATAYEYAVGLEPLNIDWTLCLADLYTRLGSAQRAITLYRSAIQQHQLIGNKAFDVLNLHNNLARVLADVGQTSEAINEYRFVLTVEPDNWFASQSLPIVLKDVGEFEEALSRYQALLKDNPQDISLHWNYAIALDEAGLLDKAIDEWRLTLHLMQEEPEIERSPSEEATAKGCLGILLAKRGEVEAGVSLLQEAIASEPEEGHWHYAYGEILDATGQTDYALAEWRIAAMSQNSYYAERAQALLNRTFT